MFEDKTKTAPAKIVDSGQIKMNKLRTYFSSDKSQNIFIALSRLPKVDIFLSAVDNLNDKTVSMDNLQALIRNWPADEYDGLLQEAQENPEEKWDKSETFFVKLGTKKKFDVRIKLWLFKLQFQGKLDIINGQQDIVLKAFSQLADSEYIHSILGSILKIGNVMNAGNKARGQADGFELDGISKANSLKTVDGESMMKVICNKMFEKDEKFAEFRSNFEQVFQAVKCVVGDLQKEADKVKKELVSQSSAFDLLKKVDPDVEDIAFGKQMVTFLSKAETTVGKCIEKNG